MKSARNGQPRISTPCLLGLEHHLDVNIGLDGDRSDLLDGLGRRVEVDDALVHAHFPAVPGVGTLTARRLARGKAQHLGGHANRAAHLETLLITGATDQIGANLADQTHVNYPADGRGQGRRPMTRRENTVDRAALLCLQRHTR